MKFNPKTTAVLSLDFQAGILGMVPGSEKAIPAAKKALDFARENKVRIIHIGLGFLEGHPEIPTNLNSRFARVRDNNLFVMGTPTADFHPDILKSGEQIIYKQRVSAFSENRLDMVLRALGITHLILFGISTSGITLSTLRRASDLDYVCTVIKDACFDQDEEVHRVLTEKVFTMQATVLTANEFMAQTEWIFEN